MPDDKTYDGRVVYLTDLLDKRITPPKLEGFTFTGRQIYGPMVVTLIRGNAFNACNFRAGSPDEMFFEVPDGSQRIGLVGLFDCSFTECIIEGVAIAGTPEMVASLRAGLN